MFNDLMMINENYYIKDADLLAALAYFILLNIALNLIAENMCVNGQFTSKILYHVNPNKALKLGTGLRGRSHKS